MIKKERWYYTSLGKTLRGFLCLIALAIVASGSAYLFKMYTEYGMYMFATQKVPYTQTDCYKDDLKQAVETVQQDAMEITGASTKVVVYDTVYQSYVARTAEAEGAEVSQFSFDGESSVKINQRYQKEMPFSDYTWVTEELNKKQTGTAFVHFSKETFKNLFVKCGKKNKEQKYSEQFSEECYFVFPNKSMEEDPVVFAVYDPERDIYYTTEDDYFPAYNAYFYRFEDISGSIDMGEYEYDNIVFPLLRSYNYDMSYIVDLFDRMNNEINDSLEKLQRAKDDAFVYSFVSNQWLGDWNSNVAKKEDITSLPKFYYLQADGELDIGQTSLSEELGAEEQSIVNSTSWWPSDMEFYFAMDYDRAEKNLKENGSGNKKNMYYYFRYQKYNNGKRFFLVVLVLDVLGFAAMAYLLLGLIKTTGKKREKDNDGKTKRKVHLNVFDKMPTELYLILMLGFLVFTGYIGSVFFVEFYKRFQEYMTFSIIGIGVTTFVYGFFVLECMLSFVRRVKVRNIISQIKIVDLIKWMVKRGVEIYYKQNGKRLFLFLFECYMGVQAVILLMLLSWALRQDRLYPYLVIVCVSIIPNILAIVAVNKLFKDVTLITQCMDKIREGDVEAKCGMTEGGHFLSEVAAGVDGMGEGIKDAVEKSIRDERMRTELITNVSHDLKTPLTSIINYVDLLKKEDMHTDAAKHYIEVLEQKSQRLKHLTEDLVEAAKANTGNIELDCMPLAFDELMRQAIGEFEDKFALRQLSMISSFPQEPVIIMADGRRLFRIVENVLQNAYKYAMQNSRIYADLFQKEDRVIFELKNISSAPLNISPDELMERFTRGDSSRSTEGSGLGLSIAKDLTVLMDGQFSIKLDGDLFKVVIDFPIYVKPEEPKIEEDTDSEKTEAYEATEEAREEMSEEQATEDTQEEASADQADQEEQTKTSEEGDQTAVEDAELLEEEIQLYIDSEE